MSTRKSFTDGEEAFARAAWDQLADTEASWNVEIEVSMSKTARKGVFLVVMTVIDNQVPDHRRKVAKLSKEWPGSTAASLGAHLYQMAHSTAQLTERTLFALNFGDPEKV